MMLLVALLHNLVSKVGVVQDGMANFSTSMGSNDVDEVSLDNNMHSFYKWVPNTYFKVALAMRIGLINSFITYFIKGL